MSGSTAKQILTAVRPVASANAEVLGAVQDLVRQADTVKDPEARAAMLAAARRILSSATEINRALQKVADVPA